MKAAPAMTRPAVSPPLWLAWLRRQVQRHGEARVRRVVMALSALLAGAAAAGTAWLFQLNQPAWAALAAGLSAALVAPWLGVAVLQLWLGFRRPAATAPAAATRDPLTGIFNRQHFIELAEREFARCRRYHTAAAMLLIDGDHFRRINDLHGHRCGDAVLRQITRVAMGSLRAPDLLARFGGEELIVLLPHTDPLGALDVADRIRERVSELRLRWQGQHVPVTVSVGVAALDASHASLDALIHDADRALFAAKEAGRNCVRATPIEPRQSDRPRSAIARRP
jgi:diguanylate cyclase (GGDEF)-like protein